MTDSTKLLYIKIIHTLIWLVFVIVIFYILYAGVFDKIDVRVWVAIVLVLFEGLVLLLNRGKCPLTPLAAQYTDRSADNFDIFLPNWLARHNKVIFTSLYVFGVLLVILRTMK